MGQKVHPKGFRLITTQKYLSNWFTLKKNYLLYIKDDYIIRIKIKNIFDSFLTLSEIKIIRHNKFLLSSVNIIIFALFPNEKTMSQKLLNSFIVTNETIKNLELKKLNKKNFTNPINLFDKTSFFKNDKTLKKTLKFLTLFFLKQKIKILNRLLFFFKKQNYKIQINYIKNIFENSLLIAKYIGEQLQNRVSYRRILNQSILKSQELNFAKGIKIQLSGRLNGLEIARSEWKSHGQIPLQTLNNKIDYAQEHIRTIYGIIGIKIWLYIS